MFCCRMLEKNTIKEHCSHHEDSFDCPDRLVVGPPESQYWGLIIHDGGRSYVIIEYCPWCGAALDGQTRDTVTT